MKTNRKQKLRTALVLSTLFIMIFSCTSAYASSYKNITVAFKADYKSAVRSLDGQNIRYSATTTSDEPNYINNVYWVELWRNGLFGGSRIGKSPELLRDGYADVRWSNVGSGKYYIYFLKAADGIWVNSDDIVIENY